MQSGTSRRQFINSLATYLGSSGLAQCTLANEQVTLIDLTNKRAAYEVGSSYLADTSTNIEVGRFVEQLQLVSADPIVVRHWIAQKIEQDFELGHLTLAGGWVLSRTEALTCAAITLGL